MKITELIDELEELKKKRLYIKLTWINVKC
jgi:hypothetical protein